MILFCLSDNYSFAQNNDEYWRYLHGHFFEFSLDNNFLTGQKKIQNDRSRRIKIIIPNPIRMMSDTIHYDAGEIEIIHSIVAYLINQSEHSLLFDIFPHYLHMRSEVYVQKKWRPFQTSLPAPCGNSRRQVGLFPHYQTRFKFSVDTKGRNRLPYRLVAEFSGQKIISNVIKITCNDVQYNAIFKPIIDTSFF